MLHTYFFSMYTHDTQLFEKEIFPYFLLSFSCIFSCSRDVSRTHEYAKLNWNEFEAFFAAEITSEIKTCKKWPNMCMKWQIFAWNSDKKVLFRSFFSKYITLAHRFFNMCTHITHNSHTCHIRVTKYITHVTHMLKVVYSCVMYKIPLWFLWLRRLYIVGGYLLHCVRVDFWSKMAQKALNTPFLVVLMMFGHFWSKMALKWP